MEPASLIIDRCGGVAIVAQWLGLDRTSVLRWTHPRSKGGSDGMVPTKRQAALLAKAREHGVPLEPADFFLAAPAAA
jgi:hypothetical protein